MTIIADGDISRITTAFAASGRSRFALSAGGMSLCLEAPRKPLEVTNVLSPSVGFFHPVSGPGDDVRRSTVLGRVKTMSKMVDVLSPEGGVVSELLVKDGAFVEYNTVLFTLEGTDK